MMAVLLNRAQQLQGEKIIFKILISNKILIFPHILTNFSGYRNGTCYTATECSTKAGLASGNCAAG